MTEDGPTYDESMNYNAALVAKGREMTTPKELPTQEYVLRAMAANYADGNRWDKLDLETCLKAADEIAALRAAAPAEPDQDQANKDNLALLDYIADKIGLPASHELSQENFDAWFQSSSALVAWRWRPKGAQGAWIYDPTPQWLADNMASIEAQQLYASPIPPAEPVALRQALEEIIKLSGSNAPTWESVRTSLEWEEDDDVVCEVYYTRRAYWEIGKIARAALAESPPSEPETKS